MIFGWNYAWNSLSEKNDIIIMLSAIDELKDDYCIIIYDEYAKYYINDLTKDIGIYYSHDNNNNKYIGKLSKSGMTYSYFQDIIAHTTDFCDIVCQIDKKCFKSGEIHVIKNSPIMKKDCNKSIVYDITKAQYFINT